jgi:hypothetical protein
LENRREEGYMHTFSSSFRLSRFTFYITSWSLAESEMRGVDGCAAAFLQKQRWEHHVYAGLLLSTQAVVKPVWGE